MKKVLIALMCLISLLVLCSCKNDNEDEQGGSLKLNVNEAVVVVGESLSLVVQTGETTMQIKWESSDEEIAHVSQNGLVIAKKTGKCEIKVTLGKDNETNCKISVVNAKVSTDYTDKEEGFGITKFSTVQQAADMGGVIAIMSGEYSEYVKADKKIKLIGVGEVKMRGVSGKDVSAENVGFENHEPPLDNEATVTAEESLSLTKCSFSVTDDSLKGGYAIFTGFTCKSVEIIDCTLVNYRYAIYLYRTEAKINIQTNKLSNCEFGIGVNIRPVGDMFDNYKASGKIAGNIFLDCITNTEFLFTGGEYHGDLDFYDHILT